MSTINIVLSYSELRLAAEVGIQREASNVRQNRKHLNNFDGPAWSNHIEGACGEMCLAKHLNVYWNGNVGDLDAHDVAEFEVRTARYHDRDLWLFDRDRDEDKFVLVTGRAPNFVLRGWITAAEGRACGDVREYVKDRPLLYVPQSALHPMKTLMG